MVSYMLMSHKHAWFTPIMVFIADITNMDCKTTFFSQLKKPSNILHFLEFAFCIVRSDKTPVIWLY